MLKPSAAILGAKLTNVALITDGRYSGASHVSNPSKCEMPVLILTKGFIVGHIVPEAFVGGPIALVQNGDMITIDAVSHEINMDVSNAELEQRAKAWVQPEPMVTRGVLAKYARLVTDASRGAMTDQF